MAKLMITLGLPASGKSTWAKAKVAESRGKIKRINMDDLRQMMHNSIYDKDNEAHMQAMFKNMVYLSLLNGYDVIADNTHVNMKYWLPYYQGVCSQTNSELEIHEFLTDYGICIKRDQNRAQKVGVDVIDRLKKHYDKAPFVLRSAGIRSIKH